MSFASRIKKARESKKMSQQMLAKELNVTDGTISNYEKGVAFPRWDKIIRLCMILNVDPNYLFWEDLSESLKEKIQEKNSNRGNEMYNVLDEIDQAEIKGEMKQMLKGDKYRGKTIEEDINKK